MARVWGELKIKHPSPNQQVLEGQSVQLILGIEQSYITVKSDRALDSTTKDKLHASVIAIRDSLSLSEFTRVSARVSYGIYSETIAEANALARSFSCINWPEQKVFGQAKDSDENGVSFSFRFQDKTSFSVVEVKTEEATFHVDHDSVLNVGPIDKKQCACLVEFDRGTFGPIDASRLRVIDWIEGFVHVMRRDIDKVLGSKAL